MQQVVRLAAFFLCL